MTEPMEDPPLSPTIAVAWFIGYVSATLEDGEPITLERWNRAVRRTREKFPESGDS